MNKQMKILIVEDVKLARKMAVLTLNSYYEHVDTADSGSNALQKVQQTHYHIILMDIGLPDMDGFAVAERIYEMYSDKPSSPCIFALSAYSDKSIQQQAFDCGMLDYFVKPLNQDTIEKVVERVNELSCADSV